MPIRSRHLLPGANLAGAEHVAAALLRAVDAPVDLEGQVLSVSASIGIALSPELDVRSPNRLLRLTAGG